MLETDRPIDVYKIAKDGISIPSFDSNSITKRPVQFITWPFSNLYVHVLAFLGQELATWRGLQSPRKKNLVIKATNISDQPLAWRWNASRWLRWPIAPHFRWDVVGAQMHVKTQHSRISVNCGEFRSTVGHRFLMSSWLALDKRFQISRPGAD